MERALLEFAPLYDQLKSAPTSSLEADWTKVRGLEFREALQSRDLLAKKFDFFSVPGDPDFLDSVRSIFSECRVILTCLAVSNSAR